MDSISDPRHGPLSAGQEWFSIHLGFGLFYYVGVGTLVRSIVISMRLIFLTVLLASSVSRKHPSNHGEIAVGPGGCLLRFLFLMPFQLSVHEMNQTWTDFSAGRVCCGLKSISIFRFPCEGCHGADYRLQETYYEFLNRLFPSTICIQLKRTISSLKCGA